jgi:small subunit ribosomal protein S20
MANHSSAEKRTRSSERKRLINRYHLSSMRTAVKKLRATTDKKTALDMLPKVASMLDKLAKKNMIHKNKAANLKSKLSRKVGSMK